MPTDTEIAESLEDYDVPEGIKRISTAICERFIIRGICDPMYIANLIAYKNGGGDGKGQFSKLDFSIDASETAKIIQGCYGHNITPFNLTELKAIIDFDGRIEHNTAFNGLMGFIKRLNVESEQSSDQRRKDYLADCINEALKQAERYIDPAAENSTLAEQTREAGQRAALENAARLMQNRSHVIKNAER